MILFVPVCHNVCMKKLMILLLCLIPIVAVADRKSDFMARITEYEIPNKKTNPALINAYAVNQEKLDIYRAAHPRFNFPEHIKDLTEQQAEQILYYFWDNYRFSDYKYDEILERVWDLMIHMSMADLDTAINNCIRKYYDFDDGFYAPFGSIASVQLLNGMTPKNVPEFWKILNEVKY